MTEINTPFVMIAGSAAIIVVVLMIVTMATAIAHAHDTRSIYRQR